jgi:hypothetical protein
MLMARTEVIKHDVVASLVSAGEMTEGEMVDPIRFTQFQEMVRIPT